MLHRLPILLKIVVLHGLLVSLQIVVLNRLLNAAPPMLLTTTAQRLALGLAQRLNGLLLASPQDGAMTMNIALTTIVPNSLANILNVVVLNRLLVSCTWRGGSH